jgi:hypothetical protein
MDRTPEDPPVRDDKDDAELSTDRLRRADEHYAWLWLGRTFYRRVGGPMIARDAVSTHADDED